MEVSDHNLLDQFLNAGDHEAFAELVRRYLPLVHAAALRLSGSAGQAEEISQIVMSKLARLRTAPPASLPLVAWMHRNTRSTALDLLRAENRRRRRESLSASLHATPHHPFPWEEIAPVLDEVIDELPDRERELVLRRFFQGYSHAAIAESLGLSEDAARMRINRTLEKMRTLLRKRGVTTTATALALGMPACATPSPVPPGLAVSIPGAALAPSLPATFVPSFLTAGILVMTSKTTVIAGAILLLAGTGLMMNHAANAPASVPGPASSHAFTTALRPPAAGLPPLRKNRVSPATPAAPPANFESDYDAGVKAGMAAAKANAAAQKNAREFLFSQLETFHKTIARLPEGGEKENAKSMARAIQKRLNELSYGQPPGAGELAKFLEQSGHSPESLGWAYANTRDPEYLREGLDKDSENVLLRYLAALMTVKPPADSEAAALSKASSQWLEEHQPGLHAALWAGEGNPLSPSLIEALNTADLSRLPEDILARQDGEFLKNTRELSEKEAAAGASLPEGYSLRSKLTAQAMLSNDLATKAACAHVLSRSDAVDASLAGLDLEWKLYQFQEDADLRNLLGDSRENLLSGVQSEIQRLRNLADFRDALFKDGDEASIRTFHKLSHQMGEKAALRQLKDEAEKQ